MPMKPPFLFTPAGDRSITLIHTWSIASVKARDIFQEASQIGFIPRYIHATQSAIPFVIDGILRRCLDPQAYTKICEELSEQTQISQEQLWDILWKYAPEIQKIYTAWEPSLASSFGRGVREIQHITSARVGSILVAPASANMLARIANGTTDNFALEVIRAFNPSEWGRVFIAPAMNTQMLHDPAIQDIVLKLQSPQFAQKYIILPTLEKILACGEIGDGAMLDPLSIFKAIREYYSKSKIQPWTKKIYGKASDIPLDEIESSNLQKQYLETLWYRPIFPLKYYPFIIPTWDGQNAFAAHRKHDIHTGIDLFWEPGEEVLSMTEGIVTDIRWFTGEKANISSPWWHDTSAVFVRTPIGVIVYGEIEPTVQIWDTLKPWQPLWKLTKVLNKPESFPYPKTMLHLELYESGFPDGTDAVEWHYTEKKWYDITLHPEPLQRPEFLQNPIYLLELAEKKEL